MVLSNRIVLDSGVSTLRTPGKVYFVQAEGGGLIKIGWATKPAARIFNMQMYCPVRLDLLLEVVGSGQLERTLHVKFATYRRHGEWFEPAAELLELIDAWRREPPPAPEWKRPEHKGYEPQRRRRPILPATI